MAKSGDQQVKDSIQNTSQTQSSQTNPWSAAQPMLQSLIAKYSGLDTGVTTGQQSALDNLMSSTAGLPNFGTQGANAVGSAFDASSTAPQIGMLKDALSGLNKNIGGTASGANLNPLQTPGFSDALSTTMNDITNRVKGVYAGSGRDPSGAGSFAKSLGRGLTEGTAPTIAAEADRLRGEQQGAASTLYNAGTGTAGNITGQNTAGITNAGQSFSLANLLPQLFASPATAQLGAANTAYQTPYGNLAAMLGPAAQLGGMGGSSTGQSSGMSTGKETQTQMQSPMSNILGGISSGIGLLSFLSDERAKDDVREVGKLHDGQPVVSFRYKGDPRTQIGLLAQNVAKAVPDAVEDFGDTGMLAVNYKRATDRAAQMRAA